MLYVDRRSSKSCCQVSVKYVKVLVGLLSTEASYRIDVGNRSYALYDLARTTEHQTYFPHVLPNRPARGIVFLISSTALSTADCKAFNRQTIVANHSK